MTNSNNLQGFDSLSLTYYFHPINLTYSLGKALSKYLQPVTATIQTSMLIYKILQNSSILFEKLCPSSERTHNLAMLQVNQ